MTKKDTMEILVDRFGKVVTEEKYIERYLASAAEKDGHSDELDEFAKVQRATFRAQRHEILTLAELLLGPEYAMRLPGETARKHRMSVPAGS
jgi:hypothetical protein